MEIPFEEIRAMNRAQGQSSPGESRRPLLTDAPDWFNRARTRTNQQPVFQPVVYQPRPVPLPEITLATRFAAAPWWLRPKSTLIRVLPLIALPLVFGIGYWSRGIVRETVPETAIDARDADDLVSTSRPEAISQQPVMPRTVPPAADHAPAHEVDVARNNTQPAPGMRMPREIDPRFGIGHDPSRSIDAAITQNPDKSRDVLLADVESPQTLDGFSLKRPVFVREAAAEVIRPIHTWFETAAEEKPCATGTCPLPVARLDRRLNTALEWSPTPQAAAEQAEREGKLVFLIHVSGNFAQPGFT
jgi:hypothetical protein